MGESVANQKSAQSDKRRLRLAEALRRNLKRRKAQARSRGGDKPDGEPGVSPEKNPDADGN